MPALAPPALIFFCNSILFISLFTRLPAIQAGLGIDKAVLGFALLGSPLGTFLALPIAGRVTDRLTPRVACALMLALVACLVPLFALVPLPGFVLCFVLFGFLRTILEVAQNMVSTEIEISSGVKVLARSHGFWSVGLLFGTICSGLLAGWGVPAQFHLAGVSLVVLVSSLLILRITPVRDVAVPLPNGGRRQVFALPSKPILLICLMIFGVSVVEGAIYDWGTFYIREILHAEPTLTGLLFACFTIGMGATRMIGDRLRELLPPRRLVRGSALCVAFGILLLFATANVVVGGVALFLIGAGIALNAPLAIATTMSLTGRPPSENLAALSLTMLVATLGVPPLLGVVAEGLGLDLIFLVLLPFVAVTFLMAPISEGARPRWLRRATAMRPAE
jgi:predicted MFS family arabinose efflux permease